RVPTRVGRLKNAEGACGASPVDEGPVRARTLDDYRAGQVNRISDREKKLAFGYVDGGRGPVLRRVLRRVEDRVPQAASAVSGILAVGFGIPVLAGAADIIFLGRDRGSAGGESGRQHDCKKSKERRQPALSTLRELDQGPVILPAARP